MPLGPKQSWNIPPNFEDNVQQDWSTWITGAVNLLQGPTVTPAPPNVTTIPHAGAVQIVWNEVNAATSYAVYETSSANAPAGVPITTVPANRGTLANSYLR